MPDFIRYIYGRNPVLSILTILCTLIVPFGWMVTQLVGFGKIFATITGMDASLMVAIFAIISLAFVLPAGMTAVASPNMEISGKMAFDVPADATDLKLRIKDFLSDNYKVIHLN